MEERYQRAAGGSLDKKEGSGCQKQRLDISLTLNKASRLVRSQHFNLLMKFDSCIGTRKCFYGTDFILHGDFTFPGDFMALTS